MMTASKSMKTALLTLLLFLSILLCSCSKPAGIEFIYVERPSGTEGMLYGINGCKRLEYKADLEIPSEYKGAPVVCVVSDAFSYYKIKSVKMTSIRSIESEAFSSCIHLTDIEFGNVTYIGDKAFRGCNSLEIVKLPSSLKVLDIGAFDACENLKEIHFAGVPEAIRGGFCESTVTIYGPAGSVVEEYALKHGNPFIANDDSIPPPTTNP